jgi:anti-sigma28 factor (negative regulator of flagellin synthesis)
LTAASEHSMNEHHDKPSETRAARIARIRREIQAGTYETPARLEAAVDAFLDRRQRSPSPADSAE